MMFVRRGLICMVSDYVIEVRKAKQSLKNEASMHIGQGNGRSGGMRIGEYSNYIWCHSEGEHAHGIRVSSRE